MAEETTLPAENLAAASALKKLLSGRTLPDGSALNADVAVKVQAQTEGWGPREPEVKESLDITIAAPRVATTPLDVANTINKALSEIPALKDRVQFESDAEHATTMRNMLEGMIKKGADLPKNYLEWGGFKPDVAEETNWGNRLKQHALSIDKHPNQVSVNITIPLDETEQVNSKSIVEGMEKNIKGRLTDIKALLVSRIAKYQGVTDDAGKAAIKQKVDALTFDITSSEFNKQTDFSKPAQINISILSPEQVEASKDPNKVKGMSAEQEKTLSATNVLDSLTTEQLGKALGRSFLHAGDTSVDMFPKIAGRDDMKRAIIKSLVRLKTAKPETAKDVDTFLADNTFKDPESWFKPQSKKEDVKSRPKISTDKDDGTLHINFELRAGQAYEVIKSLAAMDAPQQQAAMAKVEETAVGAITPASQERAMAEAINQVLSAHQPAGQSR
jgi:hypothetical protein